MLVSRGLRFADWMTRRSGGVEIADQQDFSTRISVHLMMDDKYVLYQMFVRLSSS
jgi:hypothetical protein